MLFRITSSSKPLWNFFFSFVSNLPFYSPPITEFHLAFYPCITNNVSLPVISHLCQAATWGTPRSHLTLLVLQGFVSSPEEEEGLWGVNPALLRGYSVFKRCWDVHAFVHSQKKGNLKGIFVLLTPLLSGSSHYNRSCWKTLFLNSFQRVTGSKSSPS